MILKICQRVTLVNKLPLRVRQWLAARVMAEIEREVRNVVKED